MRAISLTFNLTELQVLFLVIMLLYIHVQFKLELTLTICNFSFSVHHGPYQFECKVPHPVLQMQAGCSFSREPNKIAQEEVLDGEDRRA